MRSQPTRPFAKNIATSPASSPRLHPVTSPIACPQEITSRLVNVVARLKQARVELKISLNELAQRTGIDKGTISKLENGIFDNPTIGTIQRYAKAIGKGIVIGVVDLPTGSVGIAEHVTR